ncbi:type I restriction-modification system, S subunit domain protein [Methylococcus capsulatus str. Bath]|uniref:Type I restriction-modification system, S subunit domain protein n=1 Tax=Methylococcus capsulatus (strain ATCC 33009 / NCIMB 11132 / Bath) TaxID=243233 RepID=Q60C39_METCA|nr:type I restriction-modification system, S subunit domain protein [Methylococcus capsulatus str. Bath]
MAGDMVFADASEDIADIGKAIEIIDAGNVPLVSGLHKILARPNKGSMALGFGAYLFSSEGVRKQIQREAQGAKVLGLSATRLGNVKLYYPSRRDEQKKSPTASPPSTTSSPPRPRSSTRSRPTRKG